MNLGQLKVSGASSVHIKTDILHTFVCGNDDRSMMSGTRVQASR